MQVKLQLHSERNVHLFLMLPLSKRYGIGIKTWIIQKELQMDGKKQITGCFYSPLFTSLCYSERKASFCLNMNGIEKMKEAFTVSCPEKSSLPSVTLFVLSSFLKRQLKDIFKKNEEHRTQTHQTFLLKSLLQYQSPLFWEGVTLSVGTWL